MKQRIRNIPFIPFIGLAVPTLLTLGSCSPTTGVMLSPRFVPAEEFMRSARTGDVKDFSIFRAAEESEARIKSEDRARLASENDKNSKATLEEKATQFQGDPRYLAQGYTLKKTLGAPPTAYVDGTKNVPPVDVEAAHAAVAPSVMPARMSAPLGSSAPYTNGQMTGNASLWPDEAQGSSLFRDFRAFQTMDIITIMINESSEGRKKAETDAEKKFSLSAAITQFLSWEPKPRTNIDPSNLVDVETNSKFEGDGETKRTGSLKARLSAVIMEVLPNGLLRVEGSKIVSVNNEEEVMVISGLLRQRDVDASNQADSSRIANMRIDFYGRGIVDEQQSPGWGARIFSYVWPF